jgi:phosphate starvation-inducible PhoH-like protein
MATETLHFENARFAQQLFNHEPRNLQALETELGVKATAREGWIKLDGAADGIERAKQLFASLQNMLQAGSPVKNREFMHALNVVKHEGASTLKDMVNDRVMTHDRKPRAKLIWRWRWRCRLCAKAKLRESF